MDKTPSPSAGWPRESVEGGAGNDHPDVEEGAGLGLPERVGRQGTGRKAEHADEARRPAGRT